MYRVNLRQSQEKLKETSPDLAKFLGKNVLGQTDKQIIESIKPIETIPEKEREACDAACKTYKLRLVGDA